MSKQDSVPDDYTISLDDGKYKVRREYGVGLTFYRGGDLWESANTEWKHAKCINSMVYRIAELEMAIGFVLNGQLHNNGMRSADGLSEYVRFRKANDLPVGMSVMWEQLLKDALDQKR